MFWVELFVSTVSFGSAAQLLVAFVAYGHVDFGVHTENRLHFFSLSDKNPLFFQIQSFTLLWFKPYGCLPFIVACITDKYFILWWNFSHLIYSSTKSNHSNCKFKHPNNWKWQIQRFCTLFSGNYILKHTHSVTRIFSHINLNNFADVTIVSTVCRWNGFVIICDIHDKLQYWKR